MSINIKKLSSPGERNGADQEPQRYQIELTSCQAAKVEALAKIFSSGNSQALLEEMVTGAIQDVEESMPYIEGDTITHYDEMGDPIYEDIGPTPRFIALTRLYLHRFTVPTNSYKREKSTRH